MLSVIGIINVLSIISVQFLSDRCLNLEIELELKALYGRGTCMDSRELEE
jgi:hypothetical protein